MMECFTILIAIAVLLLKFAFMWGAIGFSVLIYFAVTRPLAPIPGREPDHRFRFYLADFAALFVLLAICCAATAIADLGVIDHILANLISGGLALLMWRVGVEHLNHSGISHWGNRCTCLLIALPLAWTACIAVALIGLTFPLLSQLAAEGSPLPWILPIVVLTMACAARFLLMRVGQVDRPGTKMFSGASLP